MNNKTYSRFRKIARSLRKSNSLGLYKLLRPPLKPIILSEKERKKLTIDLEIDIDI
jgi:hypothetical protein